MEGSFAGFVERQNDPRYKSVEFGKSQRYWTSMMRSLAFSTAYSVFWSFSPYGEAGLGNVDLHAPPGLVDLVGTETMGLGWMIAEDMLDRYLIKRIEKRYRNVVIRAVARSMLNPMRSYANLLRFKAPWIRDDRDNVGAYMPDGNYTAKDDIAGPTFDPRAWPTGPAFELTGEPMFEQFLGSKGSSCMGAAGEGVVQLSGDNDLVIRIDGCQLFGFQPNHSGDALNYLVGTRRSFSGPGRWRLDLQLLGGGAKISHEYVDAEKKAEVIQLAEQQGKPRPEQPTWVTEADTNGFTVVTSGVVAYRINNGLEMKVADLSYQRSWLGKLQGMNYDQGLRFSFGISCRMGPWEH